MKKDENELWNDYEKWILDRIGFDQSGYYVLTGILHNVNFVSLVEHDENRISDGLRLRKDFYLDNGIKADFSFGKECSVLEMLAALAIRIDNEYIGAPGDPKPDKIFCEMIENLGLDEFTDLRIGKTSGSGNKINNILSTWILRHFSYSGAGSIFPLIDPPEDQRNVEIWRQMTAYVCENYC